MKLCQLAVHECCMRSKESNPPRGQRSRRVRAFDQFSVRASSMIGIVTTAGHMNNWVKTLCTQVSPLVVSLVHGLATVSLTIILLGSNALPQSDSARLEISAHDLARKVVSNELKSHDEDRGRVDVPPRKGGIREEGDRRNY
jgi:hypothetical protein